MPRKTHRAGQIAAALEGQGWSVFWDCTVPTGLAWRNLLLMLCSLCISLPAAAVPIVYSLSADVSLRGGSDGSRLDGAWMRLAVTHDTEQLPETEQAIPSNGVTRGLFSPTISVSFGRRPANAPDLIDLPVSGGLTSLYNYYPPATMMDSLFLGGAGISTYIGGDFVLLPRFSVSFSSQDFIAGTRADHLPVFSTSDIGEFRALPRIISGAGGIYNLTSIALSVEVIPEPPTLALFLSLLLPALFHRHRRVRNSRDSMPRP